MSDNEAAAWGNFYAKLHRLAENIRKQNTAPDSVSQADSSAATEANQSTRPGNYAPRRRAGQTEAQQ